MWPSSPPPSHLSLSALSPPRVFSPFPLPFSFSLPLLHLLSLPCSPLVFVFFRFRFVGLWVLGFWPCVVGFGLGLRFWLTHGKEDICQFELIGRTVLFLVVVAMPSLCRLVDLIFMKTAVRHYVFH